MPMYILFELYLIVSVPTKTKKKTASIYIQIMTGTYKFTLSNPHRYPPAHQYSFGTSWYAFLTVFLERTSNSSLDMVLHQDLTIA